MRFYSTNQGENIKVITTPRLYSSVRAPNLVSASYSPLIRKLTHRHLHQKHTLSLRIPIILFIQPDTRLRPTRDSHNSLSCCLLGIMCPKAWAIPTIGPCCATVRSSSPQTNPTVSFVSSIIYHLSSWV